MELINNFLYISFLMFIFSVLSILYVRIQYPILTGCCSLDHREGIVTDFEKLKVCAAMNSATYNIDPSWLPGEFDTEQDKQNEVDTDTDPCGDVGREFTPTVWSRFNQ